VILDIVVGAVLTVLSYSSLAIVLLIATLAAQAMIPQTVAIGLVLGANIGSGVLAMLATANASPQVRRLPLGNLIFKTAGALLFIAFLPQVHVLLQQLVPNVHQQVIAFHLGFNLALAILFIGFTGLVGRTVDRCCASPRPAPERCVRATSTRSR
jgi:phosphate:Na+ symporter